MIKDTRKIVNLDKKEEKPQQLVQSSNPSHLGFCARMISPIISNSKFKYDVEGSSHSIPSHQLNDELVNTTIDSNQIIVNEAGFIFIGTENEEDALKILNLIMAHGALYESPLHPVRKHELIKVSHDEQNSGTIMEWTPCMRHSYLTSNYCNIIHDNNIPEISINGDTLKEILSNTEKLLKHESLTYNLLFINDGYSHLIESDFPPSFILGWSVIETYYCNRWRTLQPHENIDNHGSNKKKLDRSSISNILKDLMYQGEIDKDSFIILTELREKRNDYIHERKQVTEDDAEQCLKYALNLIMKEFCQYACISENKRLFNRS